MEFIEEDNVKNNAGETTDKKESNSAAAMNYRLACSDEEMNPRRRNTMEDVHRIVPTLQGDADLSYFGIYDGHGGRQIVDFLEENLENNIFAELQLPDEASVPERLARAYLITDMLSRKLDICTSGATAVSALLTTKEGGRKLYVANAGDSRAVICCREEGQSELVAKRLSRDHSADDPEEQARIKEAGGFLTRGRVLGILAVSRSFGDHGMKDFITANPHITCTDLETDEYPFLILACDGVWDVLSDQEAVDLVAEQYNQRGPFEEAASMLIKTSIDRGTTDNVTVIVVFL